MRTVITSLRARIEEGFPLKNDQTGLLVSFAFLTLFVVGKGWGSCVCSQSVLVCLHPNNLSVILWCKFLQQDGSICQM